jgi:hypothetical protein
MERSLSHTRQMTAGEVHMALAYDPDTGSLVWKRRANCSPQWNGRFAGKEAGYILRHGYRLIEINNQPFLAHRLVWLIFYGEWPSYEIDHMNGIRADNRIANLREATREENGRNQKKHKDGRSRFKGVSWAKWAGRWEANIRLCGKKKRLGYFVSEEDAADAYNAAAAESYGEFARLN